MGFGFHYSFVFTFSPVNLEFMKVVMTVKTRRAGTEEVKSPANNDLNKPA